MSYTFHPLSRKDQQLTPDTGSASYAGAFLIGYDQVAGGGATTMPAFLLHFGEIGPTGPYLPSLWVSLWGSMAALALAIGSVFVGLVIDRFGRKWPVNSHSCRHRCALQV